MGLSSFILVLDSVHFLHIRMVRIVHLYPHFEIVTDKNINEKMGKKYYSKILIEVISGRWDIREFLSSAKFVGLFKLS